MEKTRPERAPLRVVLVDDDQLMLESLQEMVDWQSHGCVLAGAFDNAEVVLRTLTSLMPDLIITDIQMPQMDGLTFTETVRRQSPATKVLLLTAYSDFDYARRAVELGACGYLLKHELSPQVLQQRLHQLCAESRQELHVRDAARRQLLENLLLPWAEEETREAFRREFCSERERYAFCLVLLRALVPFWVFRHDKDAERNASTRLCTQARSWGAAMTCRENLQLETVAIPWSEGQALVLLRLPDVSSARQWRAMLQSLLPGLADCAAARQAHINCLLISSPCKGPEGLANALAELTAARKLCVFRGEERMLFCDTLAGSRPEQELQQRCAELSQRLRQENGEAVLEELEDLYARSRQTMDPEALRLCVELMEKLVRQRILQEQLDSHLEERYREEVLAQVSAGGLWSAFRAFWELLGELPVHGHSPRVARTIRMIQTRYGEDLTLREAAEELELSEEYLNKLFRKETGVGFSRYLSDYRMDMAKRLLRAGTMRVGEVAAQVGYRNSQYFSITFRKMTGMTPSQYAEAPECEA